MKKNAILALALQLLGIYSIISSLPYVGGLLTSLAITGGWDVQKYLFFGDLIILVLLLLAGWFLISFGNKITKNLKLSDEEFTSSNNQINISSLTELSFAIFGLYIIITVFGSLPRFFGNLYGLLDGQYSHNARLYITTIASGIAIIIQIAFGFWLFIGSKSFVKLWQKLRKRWNNERRDMDAK